MSEKYIIYTMGVKKISEVVQKVLFEKGYVWWCDKTQRLVNDYTINNICIAEDNTLTTNGIAGKRKELTFRELMELPSIINIQDELQDELAEKIKVSIMDFFVEKELDKTFKFPREWAQEEDWCKVWEKLQKKLGL